MLTSAAKKLPDLPEAKVLKMLEAKRTNKLIFTTNEFTDDKGRTLFMPIGKFGFRAFNMLDNTSVDIRQYVGKPEELQVLTLDLYAQFLKSPAVLDYGDEADDTTLAAALVTASNLRKMPSNAGGSFFSGQSDYDIVTKVGGVRETYIFARYFMNSDFTMDGLPESFKERKRKLMKDTQLLLKKEKASKSLGTLVTSSKKTLSDALKKDAPVVSDVMKKYDPAATAELLAQLDDYDAFYAIVGPVVYGTGGVSSTAHEKFQWLEALYEEAGHGASSSSGDTKVRKWLKEAKQLQRWTWRLFLREGVDDLYEAVEHEQQRAGGGARSKTREFRDDSRREEGDGDDDNGEDYEDSEDENFDELLQQEFDDDEKQPKEVKKARGRPKGKADALESNKKPKKGTYVTVAKLGPNGTPPE
jgi:hypothetical protein